MARAKDRTSGWAALTWSELEDWAGEASLERGRRYFKGGHVSNLAKSPDGTLLATVQGTQRYTTAVEWVGGEEVLEGRCTCPIGGVCKHSIAVVLSYLNAVEKERPVPTAGPDDPRWTKLEAAERSDGGDDWPEDEGYDDFEDDDEPPPPPAAVTRGWVKPSKPKPATPAHRKDRVRAMLATWSNDRLVDYVIKLAGDVDAVRAELEEQAALQTDDVRELIRGTRKEIRNRTSEEAWGDHWGRGGNIPDYGGVERRFERLFEAGQYDALLDLGKELFDLGQAQVETSNDEGETAEGIRRCLEIAAKAVPLSGRPPEDRIFYCIGLMEEDNYELSAPFCDVLDRRWPKKVWSAVADRLLSRPRPAPRADDSFGARYERGRQNRWIVTALEGAGRQAEVLPFLEAEAPLTGSYPDLVHRLLQAGRTEDARRWAMDGIAATQAEWPGIASELQSILRDMAERAKDWPTVAAHDARPFFEHPSVHAWEKMLAAARKAGVEDAVRAAAMYFAETGKPPTGRGGSPPWPLPEIAVPPARLGSPERTRSPFGRDRPPGPSYEFLIDLAMKEARLDDVLRWYDAFARDRADRYGAEQYAERVADAVAERFPERALAIYRAGAERHLVHTGDSAYREAARYLRKVKRVLEQLSRAGEWAAYEASIREQYKRRRNFIEILDRLDRDRIIGGKK
jgi:uncharacterized Zn finger protein